MDRWRACFVKLPETSPIISRVVADLQLRGDYPDATSRFGAGPPDSAAARLG